MSDLSKSASESFGSSLPSELKAFTKLFKEPVVVVGSSFRSGAHPVLQVRIGAEVARSPKIGLIPVLMEEGRKLFIARKYRSCLVKFLAIEDLLRKYGEIFFKGDDSEIRAELDFLKIHFYIMAGQANDACRIIKSLNNRGVSYATHRRYCERYELDANYWKNLALALERSFLSESEEAVFNLLGYATIMGPKPELAATLSSKFNFTLELGADIFQPLLFSYRNF